MELGSLLVLAKLITVEQLNDALERQIGNSGRLGDHLIAAGYMTEQALAKFLDTFPVEPSNIEAVGIDETDLLGLLMKQIYTARLKSIPEFADAIKLPRHIVTELVRLATEQKLLYAKGVRADNAAVMTYDLTDEGRRWAMDALSRSQYNGAAPVTLEQYNQQVNLQKITNEVVTFQRLRNSVSDLDMDQTLLEQAGPALNSGRAILLYGPPGNGKTTFALRLAKVFNDIIYVPYAVVVESQIIRVFDPSIHIAVEVKAADGHGSPFLRGEEVDARWVPCKRPFVVAGGELNLEMLDLRYDAVSKLYEAPLHMKALGGCFVIDDFGRQLVSPSDLLNRWIVPLESRVDYLKLHTGKSFSIPFDELVIFSTNLDPEDLMDPAFLRRLPYKIEIGSPSVDLFKRILAKECKSQGINVIDEDLDSIVHRIKVDKQLELAAFQPRFILDQVVASCRFAEEDVTLHPRFLGYALDNLRVRRSPKAEKTHEDLGASSKLVTSWKVQDGPVVEHQ
jgi:energy-coupling factor transporter ATP-binding protein EcfA2